MSSLDLLSWLIHCFLVGSLDESLFSELVSDLLPNLTRIDISTVNSLIILLGGFVNE